MKHRSLPSGSFTVMWRKSREAVSESVGEAKCIALRLGGTQVTQSSTGWISRTPIELRTGVLARLGRPEAHFRAANRTTHLVGDRWSGWAHLIRRILLWNRRARLSARDQLHELSAVNHANRIARCKRRGVVGERARRDDYSRLGSLTAHDTHQFAHCCHADPALLPVLALHKRHCTSLRQSNIHTSIGGWLTRVLDDEPLAPERLAQKRLELLPTQPADTFDAGLLVQPSSIRPLPNLRCGPDEQNHAADKWRKLHRKARPDLRECAPGQIPRGGSRQREGDRPPTRREGN